MPINFNKESLAEKIAQAGFINGKKSLFLLEGVIMYLSQDAVDITFRFILDVSGTGSMIVFDYIYAGVLRKENKFYGEGEIFKTVSQAGEEWTFAIEEGGIEQFLGRYGFSLVDQSDKQKLEDKYFRNSLGLVVGKINGTHAIVTGMKK